jgi:ATP-dependent DNA ligase
MYYESGDEAYLINYDNILEVKFNKDGFKLLEIWNDLDNKINHIIKINLGFFDEDNKRVFDELSDLIEQKKQVLIALKIDYDNKPQA